MEIMGCNTKRSLAFRRLHRYCQVRSAFELYLRDDLDEKVPLNLNVDGENLLLMDYEKVKFELYEACPYLRIMKKPEIRK